eukprot:8216298-Alexandrium_andersonii.AAC.1
MWPLPPRRRERERPGGPAANSRRAGAVEPTPAAARQAEGSRLNAAAPNRSKYKKYQMFMVIFIPGRRPTRETAVER